MSAAITDEQRYLLLANGCESLQTPDFDPAPVIKLPWKVVAVIVRLRLEKKFQIKGAMLQTDRSNGYEKIGYPDRTVYEIAHRGACRCVSTSGAEVWSAVRYDRS